MAIPTRVRDRLTAGLKRMIPIIAQQKDRDVSEADTVTLVKDVLAEAFGYDKYSELTSEHAIRGTYCDLAAVDLQREDCLEHLYLFSKKGFQKGAHFELRDGQDATSRLILSALLVKNDSVLGAIRRELRASLPGTLSPFGANAHCDGRSHPHLRPSDCRRHKYDSTIVYRDLVARAGRSRAA